MDGEDLERDLEDIAQGLVESQDLRFWLTHLTLEGAKEVILQSAYRSGTLYNSFWIGGWGNEIWSDAPHAVKINDGIKYIQKGWFKALDTLMSDAVRARGGHFSVPSNAKIRRLP